MEDMSSKFLVVHLSTLVYVLIGGKYLPTGIINKTYRPVVNIRMSLHLISYLFYKFVFYFHQPSLAFKRKCGPPVLTGTISLCPLPQWPLLRFRSLPIALIEPSRSGT